MLRYVCSSYIFLHSIKLLPGLSGLDDRSRGGPVSNCMFVLASVKPGHSKKIASTRPFYIYLFFIFVGFLRICIRGDDDDSIADDLQQHSGPVGPVTRPPPVSTAPIIRAIIRKLNFEGWGVPRSLLLLVLFL